MSLVTYKEESFNRVGRREGKKTTVLVDGKKVVRYVDENGNELEADTYTAKQIADFPTDSAENVFQAALEVAGGDFKKLAQYFVLGANHHMRLDAGGYSPLEKAARGLIKSGLQPFASMSIEQVIAVLEAQQK